MAFVTIAGSNAIARTYTVTAAGGAFYIDGNIRESLSINRGSTYRFDLSDSSNSSHPFALSTSSDGGGSVLGASDGFTKVGSQGSTGAYAQYVVPSNAPSTIYYYCTSHSGMGSDITISGSGSPSPDIWEYDDAATASDTYADAPGTYSGGVRTYAKPGGGTLETYVKCRKIGETVVRGEISKTYYDAQ